MYSVAYSMDAQRLRGFVESSGLALYEISEKLNTFFSVFFGR